MNFTKAGNNQATIVMQTYYGITNKTERTIPNNELSMIIHDYEKWTDLSTDIAISAARNMIKKEAKKISKYKNKTDIQHMWNLKTAVIPVTYGQLEPSQHHSENLKNMPVNHNTMEQKKTYWAMHIYFKRY